MDRIQKTTTAAPIAVLAAGLMAAWTPGSAAAAIAPPHRQPVPIHDPVVLNIGLSCKWQPRCITLQRRAMERATGFVRNQHPPVWRVHLCNRNAARGRFRVDWVGFDNCIRNSALRPPPPPAAKSKRRFHIFRR
ncbi:MAG: hypothetical protein ABIS09_04370 [Sphingomicrobium sp.]